MNALQRLRLLKLKHNRPTPISDIQKPIGEEALDIIALVVAKYAEDAGIEDVDNVIIPRDIPACYGMHENVDPACTVCPYAAYCQQHKERIAPKCYGNLYNVNLCVPCIFAAWCSAKLVTD
jgi:hypothetical protein